MIFPPPQPNTIIHAAAIGGSNGTSGTDYDRFLRLFPIRVAMGLFVLAAFFGVVAVYLATEMHRLDAVDPIAAFGLSLPLPGAIIGCALSLLGGLGFAIAFIVQPKQPRLTS